MNMESFEEERLPSTILGDQAKYMKEGLDVDVLRYQGKVLDVELPKTMILEVRETDPGVKGNTVQGGTKPAVLETGAIIQVRVRPERSRKAFTRALLIIKTLPFAHVFPFRVKTPILGATVHQTG